MPIMKQSKEQTELLNLLSNFGCIHIDQIYSLFDNISQDTINHTLIGVLEFRKQVEILDGQYLVPYGRKDLFKKDVINCIWAMLKLAGNRDDVVNSLRAASPAIIYMTVGNKDVFEIMPVNEGTLINLRTMQEIITERNKQAEKSKVAECYYVITITNKALIEKIKAFDFKIPLVVVLLDYESNNIIPTIKIYKKKRPEVAQKMLSE